MFLKTGIFATAFDWSPLWNWNNCKASSVTDGQTRRLREALFLNLQLRLWDRILLEKLTDFSAIQKFPEFLCNPDVQYLFFARHCSLHAPFLKQINPVCAH